MTIARAHRAVVISALALLVVAGPAAVAIAASPTPRESPQARRERGRRSERRDLSRHEQTIRRGRNKIRQVLRDPKASPEIKQKATELNALLDRRRALIGQLKKRQLAFVTDHQAELDQLRELSRRAREINERLDAAREETIRNSDAEVAELKQISARAAAIAESLRTTYDQEQRARRRAP